MRKLLGLAFLIFLSLLIFFNCGQRKNPLQMAIEQGGIFENTFNFSTLKGNVLDDPYGRFVLVYLPPGFQEGIATNRKYPVLFLLHGFEENGGSYQHFYNIKTIADEMTSSGEIQPMVIVMPDGSGRFGGSFFNNSLYPDSSVFAGRYEDYITQELLGRVLYDYGKSLRGVSVKAVDKESTYVKKTDVIVVRDTVCKRDSEIDTTLHPPNCLPGDTIYIRQDTFPRYDTITVTWTDTSITIPDSVLFKENFGISGHANGGYGALRIATDYPQTFGSASAMSAPLSFESLLNLVPTFLHTYGIDDSSGKYRRLDLNNLDRLGSLFFAMAVAFSPHGSSDPLPTYFELVTGKGVNLPFDSLGHTDTTTWKKWMANDLKTRVLNILDNYPDTLRNLKIYIDCGRDDEFGFYSQALSFYDAMRQKMESDTAVVLNISSDSYSGYPGYPALNNSFIYDRLRKILKFHSDRFTAPGP